MAYKVYILAQNNIVVSRDVKKFDEDVRILQFIGLSFSDRVE